MRLQAFTNTYRQLRNVTRLALDSNALFLLSFPKNCLTLVKKKDRILYVHTLAYMPIHMSDAVYMWVNVHVCVCMHVCTFPCLKIRSIHVNKVFGWKEQYNWRETYQFYVNFLTKCDLNICFSVRLLSCVYIYCAGLQSSAPCPEAWWE